MTKGVKICLAAVIVIFVASAVATMVIMCPSYRSDPDKAPDVNYVEIIQDNDVIYRIDLAKEIDKTFRVEYPDGGWNDVTVENSQIFISDADCPDKTCVKTGKLRSEYVPIACLPHKLVIRFSGQDNKNEN